MQSKYVESNVCRLYFQIGLNKTVSYGEHSNFNHYFRSNQGSLQ